MLSRGSRVPESWCDNGECSIHPSSHLWCIRPLNTYKQSKTSWIPFLVTTCIVSVVSCCFGGGGAAAGGAGLLHDSRITWLVNYPCRSIRAGREALSWRVIKPNGKNYQRAKLVYDETNQTTPTFKYLNWEWIPRKQIQICLSLWLLPRWGCAATKESQQMERDRSGHVLWEETTPHLRQWVHVCLRHVHLCVRRLVVTAPLPAAETEWLRPSVPNSSWRESNLDGPPPAPSPKKVCGDDSGTWVKFGGYRYPHHPPPPLQSHSAQRCFLNWWNMPEFPWNFQNVLTSM